jgi:hypothetical protein
MESPAVASHPLRQRFSSATWSEAIYAALLHANKIASHCDPARAIVRRLLGSCDENICPHSDQFGSFRKGFRHLNYALVILMPWRKMQTPPS